MLTAELVSEFVKNTKDTRKQKDNNVYGTAVEYGGTIFVKIDGSDQLTPVETTSVIKSGERVIVRIKDHKATVTGNITSPSCGEGQIKDLENRILTVRTEIETSLEEFKTTITGSYVSTDDMEQIKNDLKAVTEETISASINNIKTELNNDMSELENRLQTSQTTLEQDFKGFKTTVVATYATKEQLNSISDDIDGTNNSLNNLTTTVSQLSQDFKGFKTTVVATYATKEQLNSISDDISNTDSELGTLKSSMTELSQSFTEFKTTVSETYVTNTSHANDIGNITVRISQIEQTANKINFIVSSGESASTMTLTDEFYNVVSDNITLSADRINLEGLTTVNENFKILTDGTCEASDLVATNNISTNTLNAEIINVPWISRSLTRDVIVHINPSHEYSTENYTLDNEDTFQSISDLLEICPRNLNGYKLEIYLDADITENVSLIGLNNGRVDINLKGHAFKGYILGAQRSCRYYIYGNDSENTGGTTRGKIIPGAVGYLYNNRRYAICCKYGYLTVFDVDLYSGTATDYDNNCITLALGANGYLSSVKAVNSPNSLLRCQASSHCYVSGSSGTTTNTPFQAISGSIIQLNDTTQTGRVGATNYTYEADNGKVFADGVTWDTASSTDSSTTNTNTETTTTITKTINSDYGDSYRTTKYYNWKKDNTVRQGQYGYGMNKGLWFFGNDIYNILNSDSNTIISMTITIKRQTGGTSDANTHYLRAHTYKSRPSGEPTLLSSDKFSTTFSLATGQSVNISLTSDQINALKTNGAKGFALYTTSTNTGLYSVCSGSCSVKIKYKTIVN